MYIANLRIIEATRVEIRIIKIFYRSPPSHHVLASWSSKWQQTPQESGSACREPCLLPAPQRGCSASGGAPAPAWPWLPSATPAVSQPPRNVCWDSGCSLLYASNCLSMTVNIQIKQHLSQEVSWAGCGWIPVFSSRKIKVTRHHTIIVCWMSLLGTKPVVYGH